MSRHINAIGWVGVLALGAIFVTGTWASDKTQQTDSYQADTESDLAKTIANLELRVDHLENKLKDAEADRKTRDDTIEELKKDNTALTQRVERLDRNKIGQIERDISDTQRDVDDLEKRVRRLE